MLHSVLCSTNDLFMNTDISRRSDKGIIKNIFRKWEDINDTELRPLQRTANAQHLVSYIH